MKQKSPNQLCWLTTRIDNNKTNKAQASRFCSSLQRMYNEEYFDEEYCEKGIVPMGCITSTRGQEQVFVLTSQDFVVILIISLPNNVVELSSLSKSVKPATNDG